MASNEDRETIAQEWLEKIIADGFKIFIDACSLLDPHASLFWLHIIPLLKKYCSTIIVPLRVIDEIQKHKSAPDKELANIATETEKNLIALKNEGFIEIRGEKSDKFADNVFLTVFTKFRQEYNLLLITQDINLALDILNLNYTKSVDGKKVLACKINYYGYLSTIKRPENMVSFGKFPNNSNQQQGKKHEPSSSIVSTSEMFKLTNKMSNISDKKINVSAIPAEGDALYTDLGKKVKLIRKIGDGGEGVIYTTDTEFVAKIYKKDKLTEQKETKIKLMLSKQIRCDGICYPVSTLYNYNKEFVGFLMPKAQGKELAASYFLPRQYIEKEFPNWKRKETVKLCLTILTKIKFLHDRNIILGDINPGNILVVSPEEAYFVDTDSYQIEGFPCTVGMINFTAPELHKINKKYSDFLRTMGNEYFAVATLLFMIMLPGKPPYSHQGGGDQKDNIISMDFSYPCGEISNKKTPDGPWRFAWSHLPRKIKEAFYHTFAKGGTYSEELSRLDETKWISLFEEYLHLLESGKLGEWDIMSEEIFPTRFKKDRNKTYINCRKCGNEIEEERSRNGMCFSCFSQARHSGLLCSDCGKRFYITNGEVEFLQKKGWSMPKRCPTCRDAKKERNKNVENDITGNYAFPSLSQSSSPSSSKSPSWCFITTAVCDYFNKPDDCYELTLLRTFRDFWLTKQHDGKALIGEYYAIAPQIARAIANETDKDNIYGMLYDCYIAPCIKYIENNEFDECKDKYIEMVNSLKNYM
ncbi:MAG: zinc-ribbon domain containing protein [Bacteroidales bacterium]|nr:zinc-ribbon domain containing protein [Bacteroidales bacterium]